MFATEGFLVRLPSQIHLMFRAPADIFTVEQLAKMADRLASVPTIQGASANFKMAHWPRSLVKFQGSRWAMKICLRR